ncbi:MAG: EAL domain-containing protein [Gammaproteobacteria bacterium]|nr:EAL domain-containing protein [Gammaproteobacteria bacterium]
MNFADQPIRLHLLALADTAAAQQRLEACGTGLARLTTDGATWHTEVVLRTEDFLAALSAGRADALLLDCDAAEMEALLQQLRERDMLTPILVVTTTAQPDAVQPDAAQPDAAQPDAVERLLAAGADEYLPAQELTPLLLERSLRLCTRTQALESRLEYLAQHDLLTGLPNASLFERQLDMALHTAERHGRCMAVVSLQLDDFQDRARREGQKAAETLLEQSAQRLRSLLRRSDLVARSQGEEFLLLLECSADLSDLALTASRILESLAAADGITEGSSASLGIAIFPRSSQEPRQLLEQARAALNQVRDAGGHDFRVYDESLEVISRRRVLMEQALPGAIAREEFDVRYQPRFDLESRRIAGAEVLLRWHSPDFGAVSPDQFIPVAESTGAITRIGGWVLEEAIRAGRHWMDAGHAVRLAVNVSAGQFRRGDFSGQLSGLLKTHGLPGELLELELTEGVFVANVVAHRELFASINELGVGLSVDDFGTGYSALAYLRHFPVHALKIDRTFITGLPDSEDDCAIVRAIIAMGHALDLRVVAEGVDAMEQLRFLTEVGCDEIQGYLVGKPMTAEAFGEVLANKTALEPDVRSR